MKKLIFLAMTLLIAAFLANYFRVVSIPWLEVPQVTTYTEKSQQEEKMLEKLGD